MKWADLASSPEFADLWRRWLKINIASVTKTTTGAPSSGKGSAKERRQDLGGSCSSKQIPRPAAPGPHPRPTESKLHVRPTVTCKFEGCTEVRNGLAVWFTAWAQELEGLLLITGPLISYGASDKSLFLWICVSTPKKWGIMIYAKHFESAWPVMFIKCWAGFIFRKSMLTHRFLSRLPSWTHTHC